MCKTSYKQPSCPYIPFSNLFFKDWCQKWYFDTLYWMTNGNLMATSLRAAANVCSSKALRASGNVWWCRDRQGWCNSLMPGLRCWSKFSFTSIKRTKTEHGHWWTTRGVLREIQKNPWTLAQFWVYIYICSSRSSRIYYCNHIQDNIVPTYTEPAGRNMPSRLQSWILVGTCWAPRCAQCCDKIQTPTCTGGKATIGRWCVKHCWALFVDCRDLK